jgi:hypothetical protein
MKATQSLHDLGQSLWLDNITRKLLNSGGLAHYINELSVTGLTSNPSIFDAAISKSADYDDEIGKLASSGQSGEDLFFELAIQDLTRAADLFRPIYDRTAGVDGFVSLEVSPLLAYETAKTIAAAKHLHAKANRKNLFIKIPGTPEGLPAIEEAIFAGVPINVTLLFSTAQYLASAEAYIAGLERRVCAPSPRSSSADGMARQPTSWPPKAATSLASRCRARPTRRIAICWIPIAGSGCRISAHGPSGYCSPAPAQRTRPPPTCCISPPSPRQTRSIRCRKRRSWPMASTVRRP